MYGWTKKYVGIPFLSNGRNEDGCDCYGLVRLILQNEYGITLPLLSADYEDAVCIEQTKTLFALNIPILLGEKIEHPEEKAVLLMRMHGSLCHVGLYAGDGYIIHARHNVGVVLEKTDSPRIRCCAEGWYRVSKSYSISESVLERKEGNRP